MSAHGQKVLMQHLIHADSLDLLAREGMDAEVIPTEALRPVYIWAIDYFHASGRLKAPSKAALMSEFEDLLADHEVAFPEDPDDSIEWAVDDLKTTYVHRMFQTSLKAGALAMSEAQGTDKITTLAEIARDMVSLSMRMESRESAVEATEGMEERLDAYEARVAAGDEVRGLIFGLAEVDTHTHGIQPGELAVLAAGPKVGKSYYLDRVALREWQRGRNVALFTLENSVEMTMDRIACLATGVDSTRWQHGQCAPDEVDAVRRWISEVDRYDADLWVIQPRPGKRSAEQMVREAQLRGADSLLIDQLTFVEVIDTRRTRPEQIREVTHTLKTMISTGRDRLSCLLAHQINREGIKIARKVGYHEMEHLAEGSEVERTADWVFSLYQSREMRQVNWALLQILAARRADIRNWSLNWEVANGLVRVRSEVYDLEQMAS